MEHVQVEMLTDVTVVHLQTVVQQVVEDIQEVRQLQVPRRHLDIHQVLHHHLPLLVHNQIGVEHVATLRIAQEVHTVVVAQVVLEVGVVTQHLRQEAEDDRNSPE